MQSNLPWLQNFVGVGVGDNKKGDTKTQGKSERGRGRGKDRGDSIRGGSERGRGQPRGDKIYFRGGRGRGRGRGRGTDIGGDDQGERRGRTRGRGRGRGNKREPTVNFVPSDAQNQDPSSISYEVPINNPNPRKRKRPESSSNERTSRDKANLIDKVSIKKHIQSNNKPRYKKTPKKQSHGGILRGTKPRDADIEEQEEESDLEDEQDLSQVKITFTRGDISQTSDSSGEYEEEDSFDRSSVAFNEQQHILPKAIPSKSKKKQFPGTNEKKRAIPMSITDNETEERFQPATPFNLPTSTRSETTIRRSMRNTKDAMDGVAGTTFIPIKDTAISLRYTNPTEWNPTTAYTEAILQEIPSESRGSCTEMCSTSEYNQRIQNGECTIFERDPVTSHPDRKLAVARYTRSGADNIAVDYSTIRTHDTLVRTADYLFDKIIDLPEERYPFEDKCNFLMDRFRSIRKEITIQHIYTPQIARILENMVRFAIVVSYRSIGSVKINAKLLSDEFKGALLTLRDHAYPTCREYGIVCPNEGEMMAYQCLWEQEDSIVVYKLFQLESFSMNQTLVDVTTQITSQVNNWHFRAFFTLLKTVPVLFSCLMFKHAHTVRLNAIQILRVGYYRNSVVSIRELEESLFFDDENQVIDFLAQYEIFPVDSGATDEVVRLSAQPIKKVASPVLYKSAWMNQKLATYSFRYLATHCDFMSAGFPVTPIQPRTKPESSPVDTPTTDILEPSTNREKPTSPVVESPEPTSEEEEEELEEAEEEEEEEEEVKVTTDLEEPKEVAEESEEDKGPTQAELDYEKARNDFLQQLDESRNALLKYREQVKQAEKERKWQQQMEERVRNHLQQKPLLLKQEMFHRWIQFVQRARLFRKTLQSSENSPSCGIPRIFGEIQFTTPNNSTLSAQDAMEHVQKLMKPLYLPAIIGKTLREKNSDQKNLYWKMSICSLPSNHQHTISLFSAEQWLFEKLRYPQGNPMEEFEAISLFSFYESTVAAHWNYKVACQWVSPQYIEDAVSQERLRTTQALVFLFHNGASLSDQLLELFAFIEVHRDSLCMPLCILNATGQVNQEFVRVLDIQQSLSKYEEIISRWHVKEIPVDVYHRIRAVKAEENLCASLNWLAEASKPQPRMQATELQELVEQYIDQRAFSFFEREQMTRRAHPNVLTAMFRKALSFTYETIKQNSSDEIDWPVKEFVRGENTTFVVPSDPRFDPDIHAGESYYMWNDEQTKTRLQKHLECLNMPNFPLDIDLFDYEECGACALAYVAYCFDGMEEESLILATTKRLIQLHQESKIFPWKYFLCGVFDMKMTMLQKQEAVQRLIYCYEDKYSYFPSLSVVSLAQEKIQEGSLSVVYQYKKEVFESESDSDDGGSSSDNDNILLSTDVTHSPPTKKRKIEHEEPINEFLLPMNEFFSLLEQTRHGDEDLRMDLDHIL